MPPGALRVFSSQRHNPHQLRFSILSSSPQDSPSYVCAVAPESKDQPGGETECPGGVNGWPGIPTVPGEAVTQPQLSSQAGGPGFAITRAWAAGQPPTVQVRGQRTCRGMSAARDLEPAACSAYGQGGVGSVTTIDSAGLPDDDCPCPPFQVSVFRPPFATRATRAARSLRTRRPPSEPPAAAGSSRRSPRVTGGRCPWCGQLGHGPGAEA